MFEKFLKELAYNVFYGEGNTDNPECPQCGGIMQFNGGDLDYGEGYWKCGDCGYSFTENDLNEYN